jgi:peptidoglycan biosynthesis protein MviN/MurJ (putative lipid II flippase)
MRRDRYRTAISSPATTSVATKQLLDPQASVSHSSLMVSITTLVAGLLGAGQALLIAFIVGEGDKTDAFLAAYALYVVFAIFGASIRSSVVPLIGSASSDAELRKRVSDVASRLLLIALLALVLLLIVSPLAGQVLTHGLPADARWTAVFALMVLSPAAFCQIHAATLSAALAAGRRFSLSATLYALSAAVGFGCSALLLELLGVLGAAFGVLAGAILLVVGHSVYLGRFGIRLRPQLAWLRERTQRQLALTLFAGAALLIAFQADLAISLSAISSDESAITAYTYAFYLVVLIVTLGPPALALSTLPDLVGEIARQGSRVAEEHLPKVAPYAFAVVAPLLVAFAFFGEPVLQGIFAHSMSDETVDLLYDLALLLELMALSTTILFLTSAITLALGRSRWFIVVGGAGVLVHAGIVIPLSSIGPRAVAAGHAVSIFFLTACLLAVTFGRGWPRIVLRALGRSVPAFALCAVFPILWLVVGSDQGAVAAAATATLGLVLYAALAVVLWRGVSRAFVDLLKSPRRSAF